MGREAESKEGNLVVSLSEVLAPGNQNMRLIDSKQNKVFAESFVPKDSIDIRRNQSFGNTRQSVFQQIATFFQRHFETLSSYRNCFGSKASNFNGLNFYEFCSTCALDKGTYMRVSKLYKWCYNTVNEGWVTWV